MGSFCSKAASKATVVPTIGTAVEAIPVTALEVRPSECFKGNCSKALKISDVFMFLFWPNTFLPLCLDLSSYQVPVLGLHEPRDGIIFFLYLISPFKPLLQMKNETLLRKLMTYMEDHNIHDYGVELPQIAVMGDTSSGKSSLLSAISRIIFPSADGICTRCPTRLRMEHSSAAFKASVHINWHPTSTYARKECERTHLTDISDITEAIATAQKTILHCAEGQSVAKDIIEINISGPDYVNLTVVDLPGARTLNPFCVCVCVRVRVCVVLHNRC